MIWVLYFYLSNGYRFFGKDYMLKCTVVPSEGGTFVGAHQVANLLEGVVEKAAVTENRLFVLVGNGINMLLST